jgi:coniferyl-aldehyde dehydrogenase
MAADSTRPIESAAQAELQRLFDLQRKASRTEAPPSGEQRKARLDALIRAIETNEPRIIEAITADFGHRASIETQIADTVISVAAAKHQKRHLSAWMRPRAVPTPMHMQPAKSRLEPQPLGVIGIISPWNYPVQLALAPAAAALAAGNRVILKPSELTPKTSALLKDILASAFDESVVAVVVGGVDLGEAFTRLPWDHLVFTGSTAIGRKVAEAAAANLVPVTLELGGKSPAIIDDSADLAAAGRSIAHGKMLNAGQTCIAPDYVLVSPAKRDGAVAAIADAARAMFPDLDTTKDYSSIVSDRHFNRLKSMVEEARAAGAKIIEVGSQNALHPQRKMPLTMIIDPPESVRAMQEEIFGPVLPVITSAGPDAAIAHVNERDRPLALYWFGRDDATRDKVLARTVSGGVTVNDTLWHVAQENLPFGGVGKSGIGAYHGQRGFDTFSHLKPVFYQSRFAQSTLVHPPYTKKTDQIVAMMRKIL